MWKSKYHSVEAHWNPQIFFTNLDLGKDLVLEAVRMRLRSQMNLVTYCARVDGLALCVIAHLHLVGMVNTSTSGVFHCGLIDIRAFTTRQRRSVVLAKGFIDEPDSGVSEHELPLLEFRGRCRTLRAQQSVSDVL